MSEKIVSFIGFFKIMRLFLIVIIIFHSTQGLAQGGFTSRIALANTLSHVSQALFETTPGNYFAAGIVVDSLNGYNYNRLTIMGLNSGGQLNWTKKYGNRKFEHLDNSFISRSFYKQDNFIYYTGCVKDSNNKYVGVFIKFDFNGDTLWQRVFRDSGQDLIPQMCNQSVDGGFLITGFFQDWVNSTRPGLLIKTDKNGNELWRKSIHKTNTNVQDGKAIIQDSLTKKIIIVGYQYIGGSNIYDNILILDSLGNNANRYYSTTGQILDIIQTKDKNFVAVGAVLTGNDSWSYIFKFNISTPNQKIWQIFPFGKPIMVNYFNCLREMPNGDLLVAGSYDTSQAINGIFQGVNRITKISANGSVISNRYYNYSPSDSLNCSTAVSSIELTSDGGWLTATRMQNYTNLSPFHFVKYDSTGCDSSMAYCKIMSEVGINKASVQFDFNFEMFPNPSTDKVNFILQAPNDKKFSLKVSDVSGKEIETLHFEANAPFSMQTANYEAGFYFVNLVYEGKSIETRKLIITK
jgi:hypothetical protein